MAAKYWIKLYHEILHDPKMAMLSSQLWRRAIEMFLFAGETNSDGALPPLKEMAWTLHTSPEVLETELNELASAGIVDRRDGGWLVVKFAERQAPSPAAKRMAEFRKRKRKEETDTDTYRTVTPVTKRNESVTNPLPALPHYLAAPPLLNAWGEYQQYNIDRGTPITKSTALRLFKRFEKMGEARSIAAIDYSMDSNYTRLVEPGKGKESGQASPAETEILAHIEKYGSRQQPKFNGATNRVMQQAGGYNQLCNMRRHDAIKAIRSAQKQAVKT
jgi:DNA-binding transcriptional regulator YhcF (GntR family)